MCLYSQDNIQTLATHSPTFVWEGGGGGAEKELEAPDLNVRIYLEMEIGIRRWKTFSISKKNKH